ncbi:MAG: EamA family transporter [Rhodospirillales bacterium]|nr:MAG: EamA family transporter [Rhodospirillales bacterium]
MSPLHTALALLVAVIWGLNFAVIRIGLDSFPPLLMTALRFAAAALPVLWLPFPKADWRMMLALAATWYLGQFTFLFSAMHVGMPPGLAAVVVHTQAPLTVLFALAIGERPTRRQSAGIIVAVGGLVVVAASLGGADATWTGFALAFAAAVSWATGNILAKRVGGVDMALISWLSLLAPLPALGLSLAIEGPSAVAASLLGASFLGWMAIAYLAAAATWVAYLIWGGLLSRYSAGAVTPFALLVPVISAAVSYVAFAERFGPLRLTGMALIVCGLAILAVPARRARAAR